MSSEVKLILGVNTVIFILFFGIQLLFGVTNSNDLISSGTLTNNLFTLLGGFNAFAVSNGEIWLLITSNFTHVQLLHFAVNMYALVILGQAIDAFYDKRFLIFTFVLGGFASSVATYMYFLATGDLAFSVGASGGIFAYLGLLLAGVIKDRNYGGGLPIKLSSLVYPIILTVGIGFLAGINVNNVAHFGGLAAGFLIGYVLSDSWNRVPSENEKNMFQILYNVSIFLVVSGFAALVFRATLALFN